MPNPSYDPQYLNGTYVQKRGAAEIACYAILIHYFSKGLFSIADSFTAYAKKFNLLHRRFGKMEDTIADHYSTLCQLQKKAKLAFIGELHADNQLSTAGYCQIASSYTESTPLELNGLLDLRMNLITGGIAMVRYRIAPMVEHCIIVGYDRGEKLFFKRDPQIKYIMKEDFLLYHTILEYILFEENVF